jgi:hypothetical protein
MLHKLADILLVIFTSVVLGLFLLLFIAKSTEPQRFVEVTDVEGSRVSYISFTEDSTHRTDKFSYEAAMTRLWYPFESGKCYRFRLRFDERLLEFVPVDVEESPCPSRWGGYPDFVCR